MGIDVLVCNLTRLGDLLQSQETIDDLHEAGLKVGLLCQENFASALPLLRNVDMAWKLPGASLLAKLDRSWASSASAALDFGKTIREEGAPRAVINLTPTLPARLLCRLAAGPDARQLGFGLDNNGFGLNNGVWASFLAVAARRRVNAPFNIADMMRMLAAPLSGGPRGSHLLAPPRPEALAWARAFLAQSGLPENAAGLVAFQPGASQDNRRWPGENFRELGRRLWHQARMVPLLLGSAPESPLGDSYARDAGHPFINAIGRTDLPGLAALLAQCRLLVTNDTGTMHMASGLGLPSLSFFLATAQPWDTGPLAPGCCCLEPAMACHPCSFNAACGQDHACRTRISPDAAASLILGWLEKGRWTANEDIASGCRVWLTGTGPDGFARLRRLDGGQDERSLWLEWTRIFWRQLLDDIDRPGPSPCLWGETPRALPACAPATASRLKSAADAIDALAACGGMLGSSPRAGQIFLRHCEKLQAMLDECAPLDSLAAFWSEFRSSQGGDLEQFLRALPKLAAHCRDFGQKLEQKV